MNVSRETLVRARELYRAHQDKFEPYLDELLWWNQKINLVSREVSRETLQEHCAHSLLPVVLELLNGIDSWTDAGTGGGLPGIPLAITVQQKTWTLNDIAGKKIAAVKQMAHCLHLKNVRTVAGPISSVDPDALPGVVTKHAFSVRDLYGMMSGKEWKRIIMYKGAEEAKAESYELDAAVTCRIYSFDFGAADFFFTGKGLLVLERKDM